jgi:hypothetical protein
MRKSHPGLLQLLEKLTNVCGMAMDGDREAFFVFFDILVPAVAGRKIWMPCQMAVRLISEPKKAVSVLDEAFTILTLENYWAGWHEGAKGRVTINTWDGPMWHTPGLINCAPFYKCSVRQRYISS